MKIFTDYKWKQFKYGYEAPKKILDSYDWLDESHLSMVTKEATK